MQVIQHLWRRRRVRIAGVLDQVAVDSPDDLAAIYRDYWELVYKRCYATLQDHEAASDATQDVFEQALTSFAAIRHDVVRGLMDLARTISYERKRRPTREVPLAELTARTTPSRGDDNDPAEIAERHRVLHAVWSGLSPVERRYVADKFAGFSFEEIARRRGRALGTVSSNLARAHEHARKMREPLLPGILALVAWRRLTELSRRARSAAQSGSMAAAAQPVGSFTVSLTLAGLVAAAVPMATAAQARGMRAASAPVVTALATESAGGAVPASAILAGTMGSSASVATAPTATATARSGRVPLVPTGTAASETPEDMRIDSATPSPNYDQDHTILALGWGTTCQCRALLMSTDGGASWTAQAGPPAGDEITMSPTFPADPAIYVGYADGNGTVNDYWTPRFGTAFRSLSGLPAGVITLPAGFDRGDDRIIVATPNGVWSQDAHSGVARPILLETAYATPSVATWLGAPDAGVMVLTTSRAMAPDQTLDASSVQSGEVLWSCPPRSPCTRMDSLPMLPGSLLRLSPQFRVDRTLVVYGSGGQVLASGDGGSTFQTIALPAPNANPGDLVVSSSGAGAALWATVPVAQGWALMNKPTLAAPWHEADGGNPTIRRAGGEVVVAGAQRMLFLSAQGGLLCTVNGGVTWEARCSAA